MENTPHIYQSDREMFELIMKQIQEIREKQNEIIAIINRTPTVFVVSNDLEKKEFICNQ